jgi:hypothetical protein
MKKLAAIGRSRVNRMAHAAGQATSEQLKQRWMADLERLLDEGASYRDMTRYLDARGAEIPSIDRSKLQ